MQPKASRDDAAFVLERFLPYELSIAANLSSRRFARRYSACFGLSIAEWRVMAVVGRFGAMSPGAIAGRTEMDKVKVSRAVASLVAAGRAAQASDPRDGRARLVRLTEEGSRIHAAIVPMARALEAELAAGLRAEEWAALHEALRKLTTHLRVLDAGEPPSDAAPPD